MRHIIKIMMLSALVIIPSWVVAKNSNPMYTHKNTPIELGLVSSNLEFKLAGVCFLGQGDCGEGGFTEGDEDMSLPVPPIPETPAEKCQKEGFVATCKTGEEADQICPYDPQYKTCKCNVCEGFSYSYAEAATQGYVSDGSCQSCEVVKYKRKENPCSGYRTCECGGEIGASACYTGKVKKFSNCKSCIEPPTPEAQCISEGFVSTCKIGEVVDVVCPYQSDYKKCKCNICEGFNFSYSDATKLGYMVDESCYSCEVLTYKRKENPCRDHRVCECGGEPFAGICFTGSIKKFNRCKSCTPPSCVIGSIYYSDKTCSLNLESGKLPLGVVVYMNPNGVGGQVMTAFSIGKYEWGGHGYDVLSLPNLSSTAGRTDDDSCGNTDKLLADTQVHPAAVAARNYAPTNETKTNETKGKWCFPAAGVISSWYVNRASIDAATIKLGGAALGPEDNRTLSSTEYSKQTCWGLFIDEMMFGLDYGSVLKGASLPVRPVMEF